MVGRIFLLEPIVMLSAIVAFYQLGVVDCTTAGYRVTNTGTMRADDLLVPAFSSGVTELQAVKALQERGKLIDVDSLTVDVEATYGDGCSPDWR